MEALWIILGLIAVTAFVVIGIYNRLVALRQNREQSFADIDVQLKQRFDLIPNLLETVKGYAAHEKEVLENVTNARAGVSEAGTTSQRVAAENKLGQAMLVMAFYRCQFQKICPRSHTQCLYSAFNKTGVINRTWFYGEVRL